MLASRAGRYVQHVLLKDLREDVAARILDAKSPAHVYVPLAVFSCLSCRSSSRCSYVCGGTKMASDVRGALVQLMAQRMNSHDAAVKKLAEMQLKGRYLQVSAR
jgi:hypothetical protein